MSAQLSFTRDIPLYVESDDGHPRKYPGTWWGRVGLRAGVALVLIALTLWYDASGDAAWQGTANAALAERVSALSLAGGMDALQSLYPPLTSLLAMVIPGGALGLGIAGSIAAGITVQLVWQALARKHFGPALRAILVVSLAATPLFAYLSTTNFEAAVALAFFGVGMLDMVRFVTYANTQAGFRAGLLFAAAALSDSTMVAAALVAALASAFIVQSRRGARMANLIVIGFPTVAVYASLMLLGAAFGSGWFAMIRGHLAWDPELAASAVDGLTSWWGFWYLAPMAVIVVACVALQYPGTSAVAVLLVAATIVAHIVGLTPPGVAGVTYALLVLLAIAIVPEPTTMLQRALIAVVALLLCAIGWASAVQWPVVVTWMTLVGVGA